MKKKYKTVYTDEMHSVSTHSIELLDAEKEKLGKIGKPVQDDVLEEEYYDLGLVGSGFPDFLATTKKLILHYDGLLTEAGYPPYNLSVLYKGNDWRTRLDGEPTPGGMTTGQGLYYTLKTVPHGGDAWFWAKIIEHCHRLECLQDEDYINAVFFIAHEIGRLQAALGSRRVLPSVRKGKKADAAQDKRTDASGKKSFEARIERIRLFRKECARLWRENPAFANDTDYTIAKLAIKIAAKNNPIEFKTGKGQYEEYWDDIVADGTLKAEYNELLNKPSG